MDSLIQQIKSAGTIIQTMVHTICHCLTQSELHCRHPSRKPQILKTRLEFVSGSTEKPQSFMVLGQRQTWTFWQDTSTLQHSYCIQRPVFTVKHRGGSVMFSGSFGASSPWCFESVLSLLKSQDLELKHAARGRNPSNLRQPEEPNCIP